MAGLGDAYVRGELLVDGDIDDILRVGLKIAECVGRSRLLRRAGKALGRLLDIGCGRGGLVCRAADHYGIEVVGETPSAPPAEEARRRAAALGLGDRVEILCCDYRDIVGVSIGVYGHVGIRHLPVYCGSVTQLLRPGGHAAQPRHHRHGPSRAGATAGRQRLYRPPSVSRGRTPLVSRVLYGIAGALLAPIDWEDLRPHTR
jgi:cyclopropane-fatty-acyl-phospholipid synthase